MTKQSFAAIAKDCFPPDQVRGRSEASIHSLFNVTLQLDFQIKKT